MTDQHPTRRTMVTGAAAGGLALPLLAACGNSGGGNVTATTGTPGAGAGSNKSAKGGPSSPLTPTSAIPVGGGKIFDTQQVVVTQPQKGQFKAFSAVCTHMGCLVGQVSGGKIICPCHGSEYSITDGSVVGGPAPAPLPAEQITVKGGEIRLS